MNPENPVKVEDKYPETIFRSSYYYGEHLLSLFVNYRKSTDSFSFVVRKGKFASIYNLSPEEKLSFIKCLLGQLSLKEVSTILKNLDLLKFFMEV